MAVKVKLLQRRFQEGAKPSTSISTPQSSVSKPGRRRAGSSSACISTRSRKRHREAIQRRTAETRRGDSSTEREHSQQAGDIQRIRKGAAPEKGAGRPRFRRIFPQDGRQTFRLQPQQLDVRTNLSGTIHRRQGEIRRPQRAVSGRVQRISADHPERQEQTEKEPLSQNSALSYFQQGQGHFEAGIQGGNFTNRSECACGFHKSGRNAQGIPHLGRIE